MKKYLLLSASTIALGLTAYAGINSAHAQTSTDGANIMVDGEWQNDTPEPVTNQDEAFSEEDDPFADEEQTDDDFGDEEGFAEDEDDEEEVDTFPDISPSNDASRNSQTRDASRPGQTKDASRPGQTKTNNGTSSNSDMTPGATIDPDNKPSLSRDKPSLAR